MRHDDLSPRGALTTTGLAKLLNWERGVVVKGGQQGIEFVETGNLAENMTGFPTYGESLKVPSHMFAHVHQTMHSLIFHQQFGMATDHGAHFTQGRQGGGVTTGEGIGQVTEQPRTTETTTTNLDAGTTRLPDHGHCVAGLPDVTVSNDGDIDGLDKLANGIPVGVPSVGLGDSASVQTHRSGAGIDRSPLNQCR